jgi:hypothetical protein
VDGHVESSTALNLADMRRWIDAADRREFQFEFAVDEP